jgi:hypothetical protein
LKKYLNKGKEKKGLKLLKCLKPFVYLTSSGSSIPLFSLTKGRSIPVPATKTKAANWLLFLCLCGSEACFGKSIGIKNNLAQAGCFFLRLALPLRPGDHREPILFIHCFVKMQARDGA